MRDVEPVYLSRAERAARLLRHLPFIRLVGLNGSLVLGTASRESDIDFLVIAEYGRIYTVRLLSNALLLLFGLRRYGLTSAGRICLNRYQTTRSLRVLPENAYHARYFASLVPLFSSPGLYEAYQRANRWMARFHELVRPGLSLPTRVGPSLVGRSLEWLLGGVAGEAMETVARLVQVRRFVADRRTNAAPLGRVRWSEVELCLHPLKSSKTLDKAPFAR